jgi:hypothetical protein
MKKLVIVLFTAFGCNALVAQVNNPADVTNPNAQFTPGTPNQTGVGTNALNLNIPNGTETNPLNTTPGLNTTTGTENPVGNTPANTYTTPATQNPTGSSIDGINNRPPYSSAPQSGPPRE